MVIIAVRALFATALASSSPCLPIIWLFGDSLTEYSGQRGGWSWLLARAYTGRAAIVNKGLAGQTTRWGVSMTDSLLPPSGEDALLATVWFGANDAVSPRNVRQHVPLDEYKRNLAGIVAKAKKRFRYVVVLAPPPVHEPSFAALFWPSHYGHAAAPGEADRSLALSAPYASAACTVARESSVACIDVWRRMQDAVPSPGGESWSNYKCDNGITPYPSAPVDAANTTWAGFLCDGLHLSPAGDRFVFEELMAVINASFPDFAEWLHSGSTTARRASLFWTSCAVAVARVLT